MSKPLNILIRGNGPYVSRGVQAMVVSSVTLLNKSFPDATITILSLNPKLEKAIYQKYGIRLRIVNSPFKSTVDNVLRLLRAGSWCMVGKLHLPRSSLQEDIFLQEYQNADLIVYLTADGYSYGTYKLGAVTVPASLSLDIFLCTLMSNSVVLFPFSAGPFPNRFVNFLTKTAFNRTKVIMPREKVTQRMLHQIGVTSTTLMPDVAFILPPASEASVAKVVDPLKNFGAPIIGVGISQLVNHKSRTDPSKNDYITLMAKLADYLVEKYNATVLLVPHEISRNRALKEITMTLQGGDDITAIEEILKKVKSHKVHAVTSEYNASELKRIISNCTIFIGARTHTMIAALSQQIPLLAISYSVKTDGIMETIGLSEYICNYRTMDFDELKTKIEKLWINREQINKHLLVIANKQAVNFEQLIGLVRNSLN